MTLLWIILLLAVLFALSLMGRTGHPGLPELRTWVYAHRGLHGKGVPENSMHAFELALQKGYGIELDVHLMSDGGLAVIHDSKLERTTGAQGCIEDLTTADLENYHLEGTWESIPQFQQVLELFAGKAPLIIELKAERGNHAALCQAVCQALEGYQGPYCIESFDPRCILWLHKNRPDIIRGQLSQNFLKDKSSNLPWILRFVLTNLMLNFLTQPDFVAYNFQDRSGLAPKLCQKLWSVQSVVWTLRCQQEHDAAVAEDRIPIFEYYQP